MIPAELAPIDQAVVKALLARGFSYDVHADCYLPEDEGEKFHGWEIRSCPIFAIGHIKSGHYWFAPVEVCTPIAVEKVKKVISKAIATHKKRMALTPSSQLIR